MVVLHPITAAIKAKIEKQGNLTRQDVYDILREKKGKKMKEKRKFVKDTLDSLPDEIKSKKSPIDGRLVVDKIMDDLGSYPDD